MWMYEGLSVWLPPPDSLVGRRVFPWVEEAAHLAWREDPEAYYLEGSFRGFRKKDIAIEARDRVLDVRAEREWGRWKTKERSSFRQVVTIPPDADPTQIDARFEGGWLSIRVPKLAQTGARVVPIRVNGALPPTRTEPPPSRAGDSFFRRAGDAVKRFISNLRGGSR